MIFPPHRVRDGMAIKSGRPSAQLVENDERASRRVTKNGGGFPAFHHEGACSHGGREGEGGGHQRSRQGRKGMIRSGHTHG